MASVVGIGGRIFAYVDYIHSKTNHISKYKITARVERPIYTNFDKSMRYSSRYDIKNHQKVLKLWATDLLNNKYNKKRKKQDVKVEHLSAEQAIEEFVLAHSFELLQQNAPKFKFDVQKIIKKYNKKHQEKPLSNKAKTNLATDIKAFKVAYDKYIEKQKGDRPITAAIPQTPASINNNNNNNDNNSDIDEDYDMDNNTNSSMFDEAYPLLLSSYNNNNNNNTPYSNNKRYSASCNNNNMIHSTPNITNRNDNSYDVVMNSIKKIQKTVENIENKMEDREYEDNIIKLLPNTRHNANEYGDKRNLLDLVRHFEDKSKERDEKIIKLNKYLAIEQFKNSNLTKDNKNLRRKVRRSNNRFKKLSGKTYKKYKLKINVSKRQGYYRDSECASLIKSCGYLEHSDYVKKQFERSYLHNKEFQIMVNKMALPHIVKCLNKGIKDKELDINEVMLYFTIKTCTNTSVHDQYVERIGIWESYQCGKTGRWKKRRKKDENGLLKSYGVSSNQFRGIFDYIFQQYPALDYTQDILNSHIWTLNPIACFITYCQEWMQNKRTESVFVHHEKHLEEVYADELGALDEGEILTIDIGEILNILFIDATPYNGTTYKNGTNFAYFFIELFNKISSSPLFAILPAFHDKGDKKHETIEILHKLEPYHKQMEQGITVPSLNLPIEIVMKITSFNNILSHFELNHLMIIKT